MSWNRFVTGEFARMGKREYIVSSGNLFRREIKEHALQSRRFRNTQRPRSKPMMLVKPGVLYCLALMLGFNACGHSRDSESGITPGTMRGVVYVVGNEPFTYLALQDSAGAMHRIHGAKELEDVLYQRQGKTVVITVVGTEQQGEGPVINFNGITFPSNHPGAPADSTGR